MIEILGYQTVLVLHITAFVFNVTLVVLADVLGLLWVVGKKSVLGASYMHWLHRMIWIGLTVSIITGIVLFSSASDYLLTTPAFWVKLSFVIALVINSFFITHHMKIALVQSFTEVTQKAKIKMFISGAISTGAWIGVVVSATQPGL
jgi:hypothetical protein